ncbi:hypothetical protein LCGC14_0468770 [marine sediment metagenome]|uniref:Uncharacterized protein n=1 Tax=marine sediment metagenome TaxID=412755 RepID=A0A0F9UZI6_9ZZZZ
MSRIIKPKQPGVIVPKHIIKELLDRVHRQDWEDPDRYERQKKKALTYIPVRAPEVKLFAWERLVREVTHVFHDDLALDPDIRAAAQRACHDAQRQHERDLEFADPEPEAAVMAVSADRAPLRGVDDSDETLASLEWQRKEEETD